MIFIFEKIEFSKEDIEFILKEYDSGVSLKNIGKHFNCTRKPIKRVIIENGGTIRSNYCQKYALNHNYFDSIDTTNKAYILGFLYADGCNIINESKWQYQWQLALKADDFEILQDIRNEIGYDGPISIEKRKYRGNIFGNVARLIVCNKHMCLKLLECGVVPNKTYITSFPKWLNDGLVPHFIRGVFDGDGCIDKQGHASFAGSKTFVEEIAEILRNECGLKCNLYQCKQSLCTWQCHMSGKINAKIFLDWIYKDADLKLERKFKRYIDAYYPNSNVNVAKAEKSA